VGAPGTAPPLSALEALESLRTTIDEFGAKATKSLVRDCMRDCMRDCQGG
jgi:hypothetical protein